MFAITRKIVYKWHGMGDGVRNGVEDEVLSVERLERLCEREKGEGKGNVTEKDRWKGNGCGRN